MLESLVITGLATFGITYLLVYTDGPKDIIKSLRVLAGIKYIYLESGEEVYEPPTKFFGKLLICHWCTGTWIAIFMSVILTLLFAWDVKSLIYLIPGSLGISGFLCSWSIRDA